MSDDHVSGRQTIDSVFPYDDNALVFGRDRKCIAYLSHVPLQVVRHNGGQVNHHDPNLIGANVLLICEVGVESDENSERLLGRCKELVVIVACPSLVMGGHHLMLPRELKAKGNRNPRSPKDRLPSTLPQRDLNGVVLRILLHNSRTVGEGEPATTCTLATAGPGLLVPKRFSHENSAREVKRSCNEECEDVMQSGAHVSNNVSKARAHQFPRRTRRSVMSAPDASRSPSKLLADERRRYLEIVPPPRSGWPPDVQLLFREVTRRVLDEGVTAREIVERCGFRSHEVYTRFTEHVGVGIRGYIVECRMQFARYLLMKHEDVPVQEIAYTVGYGSPEGFRRRSRTTGPARRRPFEGARRS